MKKFIFIIALFLTNLCIVNCSKIIIPKAWTENEIIGMRIELVDDFFIESFDFFKEGHAIATIGTKKAVTGPVLYWEISCLGNLVIRDDNFRFTIKKISIKNNILNALCNGKKVKYKIFKN